LFTISARGDQNTIVLKAGIIAGSVAFVTMVTMGIAARKWQQRKLRAGMMTKRFFEFSCLASAIEM